MMLGLSRTDGLLQFPLSCNVLIVDHLCALSPIFRGCGNVFFHRQLMNRRQ